MRLHSRLLTGVLALLGTVGTLIAAPPSPLLFRASFDGSLVATGPDGPVRPVAVSGKVEYRPGKVGQALVVGGDAAQDIDRAGIACHVEMDVGEANDRVAGREWDGQAGSGRRTPEGDGGDRARKNWGARRSSFCRDIPLHGKVAAYHRRSDQS